MNFSKGSKNKKDLLAFAAVMVIALFIHIWGINSVALDSDEIMWGVMADNTLHNGTHYLYFTDQNFRGSIESYVILPFYALFGLSVFTLRINTLIFGLLSSVALFYITYKVTGKTLAAAVVTLFYNLALPQVMIVQNKAWGNYVLIQSVMLLCFYFFYKIYYLENRSKLFLLIGLLSGFSFWANEQSLYFLLPMMFFAIFSDFKQAAYLYRKGKSKLPGASILLWGAFSAYIIWIFYLIARRRMIFNPILTLVSKAGLKTLTPYIGSFNINLSNMIFFIAVLFAGVWFVSYLRKKENLVKNSAFISLTVPALLIISINVINNSFSRVSAEGMSVSQGIVFFKNNILIMFFGNIWPLFLVLGLTGTLLRLYDIYKQRNYRYEVEDIFIVSFVLFPLLLVFSSLPKISNTPRYLIIWWPVCAFLVVYTLNRLSGLVKAQYKYIPYMLFSIIWVCLVVLNFGQFREISRNKVLQDQKYPGVVAAIKSSGKNTCVGDYWNVGKVMFYSKLQIKCFTSKAYGTYYKYLDIYKTSNPEAVYILN